MNTRNTNFNENFFNRIQDEIVQAIREAGAEPDQSKLLKCIGQIMFDALQADRTEREQAATEVAAFLRDYLTIEQIMAVQAFAGALMTGAVTPAFFEIMTDSFQAREDSNPWKRPPPAGWATKRQRASR